MSTKYLSSILKWFVYQAESLTLGYTLPKAVLDKMKMRHARIYFQAQNLFTITGYTGADPEGLGYPYPLPRTFSLGLSFGF